MTAKTPTNMAVRVRSPGVDVSLSIPLLKLLQRTNTFHVHIKAGKPSLLTKCSECQLIILLLFYVSISSSPFFNCVIHSRLKNIKPHLFEDLHFCTLLILLFLHPKNLLTNLVNCKIPVNCFSSLRITSISTLPCQRRHRESPPTQRRDNA